MFKAGQVAPESGCGLMGEKRTTESHLGFLVDDREYYYFLQKDRLILRASVILEKGGRCGCDIDMRTDNQRRKGEITNCGGTNKE